MMVRCVEAENGLRNFVVVLVFPLNVAALLAGQRQMHFRNDKYAQG